MRIRAVLIAGVLVATGLVLTSAPAGAGETPYVVEATAVGLNDGSDCSSGDLQIEGTTTGDAGTADVEERGVGSTLLDPELDVWSQDSDGYDGDFEYDYGVGVGDEDLPEGTVVGLYASVGDANNDPDSFAEWIVVYACGETGAESILLYSCFGPAGTCPMTAGEAMEIVFSVEVSDSAPLAGGTLTAAAGECWGTTGSLLLVDGDTVLDEVDGLVPDDEYMIVADLTVPASVTPGTVLSVVAECYVDDELAADDSVDVTVSGSVPTTAAPTTSTTAAVAVAVTPRFTG